MITTMRKNRNRMWMQLPVVAGCTLMLATACQPSAGTQLPAGNYEIMTVSTSRQELTTAYSATIRGRQDIEIYPQVSGTIQQLCVAEGDKVRQGQTLFILDQVPYQAALNTAIANVKAAEAALATAELNYDSNKELFAQKVVSDFTLTTAKNNYLTAQATLAQTEAQEVNARNDLSYTVVKSPSDGVVGTLPYRVGALVSPSIPQPLTTVSDNSTMYVYFSITENQLLSLVRQYGTPDSALVQMPDLQLRLNDQSVYEEKGRIESISGVIDRQTGTVSVRAVFPNPDHLLYSGASGSILMPSTYEDCIVIPQEATVKQQDKILVYKVVDGKATSTLIQVADVNDGRTYIVTDGLSVGDEIVAKGAGLIREGMQVK
ncbi:MAG TPA: efflux RND transporter periplasmic adaptor subunit [Candidatus Bacteroides pullicola]|uniref:Efflux RND transporter periplasmic adaptor subunit n=1 Tax=Candidatus Bacteroides pullicola TaxID=2838475 RepID=A0A9D1ZH20_9BACE|nr:efflux RND transporter periplasmic adaptor subunit [Candidatus Bacteroides pullicola]